MAIDMNVDIGEMVKGLFSKKDSEGNEGTSPKSPVSKFAVVIVLVLVIIGLYVFYFYLPAREDLRIKKTKISQIETMQFEISELSSSIDKAKIDLIAAEKNYEKLTKLFHTNKELEDLYRNISLLALSNKLMVTKIEKGSERPIFEVDVIDYQSLEFDANSFNSEGMDENPDMMDMGMEGESATKKVAFYEFSVDIEISGNYENFTNFRKGLTDLKKIININKEKIVVMESEVRKGDVKVSATIATFRLPANESEKYINTEELDYEY